MIAIMTRKVFPTIYLAANMAHQIVDSAGDFKLLVLF